MLQAYSTSVAIAQFPSVRNTFLVLVERMAMVDVGLIGMMELAGWFPLEFGRIPAAHDDHRIWNRKRDSQNPRGRS